MAKVTCPVLKTSGFREGLAEFNGVQPSIADLQLTRKLLQAGQAMGIPVLDHLILGQGQFWSLRETTTLWDEFPQED